MQATAEQALRLAKDAEGKAEASGEKLVTVSNLATAAASQSELLELAQKVSKLQAEVPSSSEIGSVKSQLDSLKGGMGALEGLSELEKGILNIGRRMDTLCDSVELSKGDILRAQTNIVHAQDQLSKNLEAVSSMGTQVDGLDRMRPLFEAVRGQVSIPPLSCMSCSGCWCLESVKLRECTPGAYTLPSFHILIMCHWASTSCIVQIPRQAECS
jgi:hypothetical protein